MSSSSNGKPDSRKVERRRLTRRGGHDRRDQVRWEPNRPNRRKGRGKRRSDLMWETD